MLLLAQGRPADALAFLEPLRDDLGVVYGPADELTREVAEAGAVIRRGPGARGGPARPPAGR